MVNIIYGQHSRNADDKNRVIFTAAIRDYLGNKFMLSIGFDGNADLRTKEEFMRYINMLEDQSLFDKRARIITRSILGNSFEITLDSMNRMTLPKYIVEKLAIHKEIIFVGAGSLVEMWSKERFDNFEKEYSLDDLAAIAQEISNK
ncbi:cell division/cell wall cluster transcriptional repressor MraZ [Mycoplasmopsis cynos]|uniref:division/cell wall cluster transcriptional repressor MraZ n=1 Tax=Mycoplasmopsis cynos TaxID=171284 RepID=UPI0024C70B9C|nr:cell division/cell wall cluster transcriptional repressor MraZ [Mycoplasmopsis cynos]WAM10615.1 cell division/cell wall cluster transcriptional repressor MraZ [Mycoplasmopsis cynos]